MARIRNIGELNYSRWHNLPWSAQSPCVLHLELDRSTTQPTVAEFIRTNSLAKTAEELSLMERQDNGFVMYWTRELAIDKGVIGLTPRITEHLDDMAESLAEDGFSGALSYLDDIAYWKSNKSPIVQALLLGGLPANLFSGLVALSMKATIVVTEIDEISYPDCTLEDGRNSFFLTVGHEKPIENIDRYLQAFARKLNGALRRPDSFLMASLQP